MKYIMKHVQSLLYLHKLFKVFVVFDVTRNTNGVSASMMYFKILVVYF